MENFQLLQGFANALQPTNLLFAFIGCVLGTLVGILPGLGPAAGIAILLPLTYTLGPTPSIIMLAAIYYGAMYGGTITSVLINLPGEAASAVTCLDGYQMAKKGRAGAALSIAAIGSFVGGNIATLALVVVAVPLTSVALKFGPPEFFGLMVFGLSLVTGLASKSLLRALVAAVIGLLISLVGTDPVMGAPRFTYGITRLMDGFNIVPVVMGLFGLSEILLNAEKQDPPVFEGKVGSFMLTAKEAKASIMPIGRGTLVGLLMGFIPGVTAIIPTFVSYVIEKRFSKSPDKFGTGMIEGVAGPETANNAYANASLIPLFTLGIPGSPAVAVLMGAFMMNGLIPGPFLFTEHPDIVWTVIASLYIGNAMLLVLNLPFVPMWVSILKIPYSTLFALILGFCMIGAYSLRNTVFDAGVAMVFGILGYVFRKLDIPSAPIILTLILGPLMEQGLRQSLEMSQGDLSIFFTRPISAGLLVVAALVLIGSSFRLFEHVRGED